MLDVEGFILVGGASSRMGADKSGLVLNGKTTVSLIAEVLRPVTPKLSVVGSHHGIDYSLPNVPDLNERWGPLGGIQAALRAGRSEFCFIVACDLPFLTSELLAQLWRLTSDANTPPEALVPMQSDGRPQPLCAIYQRVPCLIATESCIALGEHTPRAMLDRVKARYVAFSELAHLAGAQDFFFNLNRPEDYERAKQITRQREDLNP